MDISISVAEIFLGLYAVAMTYLWHQEKENSKDEATFIAQVFLDLHDGKATMVVRNNDNDGRTVTIRHKDAL